MTHLENYAFTFCNDTNVYRYERDYKYGLVDAALYVLTCIILTTSFGCIVLFLLILSANREKLKTVTNRVRFSLAVTLLANYLMDGVIMPLMTCNKINAIISHYLFISYHTWVLLVPQNCWRVICRRPTRFHVVRAKVRTHKYLAYCFVGWIMPLFVIAVGLYLDWDPFDTISCQFKPAYGLTPSCFIELRKATVYLCHYPLSILYGIFLVVVAHTSYIIYWIKRKDKLFPVEQRYFLFFKKYAVMAGLLGALNMTVMFIDDQFLWTKYLMLISPHGLCLYFGNGFRKATVHDALKKIEKEWLHMDVRPISSKPPQES